VHTLFKKDTEQRKHWIQTILPDLYADKLKDGWRIFFQDEVGFQTEGTLTYTSNCYPYLLEPEQNGLNRQSNAPQSGSGSSAIAGQMTQLDPLEQHS
jgi:hypothetical protein